MCTHQQANLIRQTTAIVQQMLSLQTATDAQQIAVSLTRYEHPRSHTLETVVKLLITHNVISDTDPQQMSPDAKHTLANPNPNPDSNPNPDPNPNLNSNPDSNPNSNLNPDSNPNSDSHEQDLLSMMLIAAPITLITRFLRRRQSLMSPFAMSSLYTVAVCVTAKLHIDACYDNRTFALIANIPLHAFTALEVDFLASIRFRTTIPLHIVTAFAELFSHALRPMCDGRCIHDAMFASQHQHQHQHHDHQYQHQYHDYHQHQHQQQHQPDDSTSEENGTMHAP